MIDRTMNDMKEKACSLLYQSHGTLDTRNAAQHILEVFRVDFNQNPSECINLNGIGFVMFRVSLTPGV